MAKRRSKPKVRLPVVIPTPAQIRAVREARGLTIEQAAERVGVQPSTWYHWETPSQKRRPSPSHAILIDLLRQEEI